MSHLVFVTIATRCSTGVHGSSVERQFRLQIANIFLDSEQVGIDMMW